MGGCCFTPTKRDFLWWYWLLLASIVGIPMLVAVLYVAWHPEADDEAKRRRGDVAAWIFWIGTFLVAMGAFAATRVALLAVYPYPESSDGLSAWFWHGRDCWEGWWCLAVQFFLATVFAVWADVLSRKGKWLERVFMIVLCIVPYLFIVLVLGVYFLRPAINVMQFLACMLPAHYWGNFKASSDSRNARKALAAFLIGATLFFVVSYFGEDFAEWICGPPHSGKF